jgi:hypothetical protein
MLLAGLFFPVSIVCADEEIKADVSISIQQSQELWAGQQVTVNLDLKTTGFSFSDSHFSLPEIDGGFLMQTDTTTVKLTENVNGEAWQVVRYPLALYPQKTGQFEIPPIDVRFSTSAGFGSQKKAFEFKTTPLALIVKLPPGAKDGEMLVTTTLFELEYDWQPQSGTARTGDAITLTVSRRANDISAMLLPPIPVYRTEGLAAYPQPPEVNDKTDRGDLTGERNDSIIWVVETPGAYNIPGIRFQWWDPANRELKQQIVPGISLDVPPSSTDEAEAEVADQPAKPGHTILWTLTIIVTVLLIILFWFFIKRRTASQQVETEQSAFNALKAACSSNKAGESHAALHRWIAWVLPMVRPNVRSTTLVEFARIFSDDKLTTELQKLQEALVTSNSNWQGRDLLDALRQVRDKSRQQITTSSKTQLAPLNPSE